MKVISIDGHPREEELAAYVSDTLDASDVERVENHVFECERCAARLQREADFQMLLHEAAAVVDTEPPVLPAATGSLRRRVGTWSGLWAAAAAMVLMVCQHGVAPEGTGSLVVPATEVASATTSTVDETPEITGDLLASVEPLQSVDPLQTWPDDPFVGTGWSDDVDGEPCGSREDGGSLVCQRG